MAKAFFIALTMAVVFQGLFTYVVAMGLSDSMASVSTSTISPTTSVSPTTSISVSNSIPATISVSPTNSISPTTSSTTTTTSLANSTTSSTTTTTSLTNSTTSSTTTTTSPTTSIISPTTSATPPPTSTPSPTFVPAPGVGPEVRINLTINFECSAVIQNLSHPASEGLSNVIIENLIVAYNNSKLKAASVIRFTCKDDNTKVEAILNVTFGTGIPAGVSIKALLVSHLSSINISATVEVNFQGITITSTPKGNECQKKCCDGAGGAITVERVCTPTDKCAGRDQDPDKQENGHCNTGGLCQAEAEKCDGSSFSPSLVVIVLLAFATFVGAMI